MAYSSPYERMSIKEVVPQEAMVKGLQRASLIQSRRRIRIIPTSGQAYGSNGQYQANIILSDGASFADLQSAVLAFRLKVNDAASLNPASYAVLDDMATSVVRRTQISVNSILCDDLEYSNRRSNMEVYGSMSKSWYESYGTLMGAWKHVSGTPLVAAPSGVAPDVEVNAAGIAGTLSLSPALNVAAGAGGAVTGTGAAGGSNVLVNGAQTVPAHDVTDKLYKQSALYKNVIYNGDEWTDEQSAGPAQFYIPMGLLSHFFRADMLFPLRNAGQLQIQLLFAQPSECLFNGGGANTNLTYDLTDLTLELDTVQPHPSYTELIDGICAKPESDGLFWSFDAHLVGVQQLPQSAAGAVTQTSLIMSKASPNVRSVHFVMSPQTGLNQVTYPGCSTFASNGLDQGQWQIRLGSNYYPGWPSQGSARNVAELAGSYNIAMPNNDQCAIFDRDTYTQTTAAAGGAAPNVYGPNTTQTTNLLYPWADACVNGYCFDQLKRTEDLLQGVDTRAVGAQVQLDLKYAPVETPTITFAIRFTRALVFSEGSVKVDG